jgi:ubiquinone/menaquinone biosynthesis C-methylase UbiE
MNKFEDFWDNKLCGSVHSKAKKGTKEWFDEIKMSRYRLVPQLPEFVQFKKYKGLKILEIGCGIGTDLTNFAENNFVFGTDISRQSLNLAEKNFKLRGLKGTFIKASATKLPFNDEYFDLIYSCGVLHHIPDVKNAISEMKRVLKPNGKIIILLYNLKSPLGFIFKLFGENLSDGFGNPYTTLYTENKIKTFFRDFKIKNVKTFGLIPHLPLFRNIEKYGWYIIFDAIK